MERKQDKVTDKQPPLQRQSQGKAAPRTDPQVGQAHRVHKSGVVRDPAAQHLEKGTVAAANSGSPLVEASLLIGGGGTW